MCELAQAQIRERRVSESSAGTGRLLWFAIGLVVLLPLLWPGDVCWINDEPNLIDHAIAANAQHRLATEGLGGSKGVRYGPLPTWIYQGFLLVSRDPVLWTVLHALLFTGVTAGALLWLAQSLDLRRSFVPVILLSPYLWLYSRLLWDNPFCIPLCALTLAAYADFLRSRRSGPLCTTIACALAALLVHLMALALVIPVFSHLLLFHRSAVRRHWKPLAAIVTVAAAASWPWWSALVCGGGSSAAAEPESPSLTHWIFPLFGGRLLTAWGLDYFFDHQWLDSAGPFATLVRAAAVVSCLALLLTWAGMLLAVLRLVHVFRDRDGATPLDHFAAISLGILLCQIVLDGLARSSGHPHYYNATWAASVILAWIALDSLQSIRLTSPMLAVQALAMCIVLGATILHLHASGGTRTEHYGTTLANQIAVAEALNRSGAAAYTTDVDNVRRFPQALRVLRALGGLPAPSRVPAAPARFVIRYTSPNAWDGHIEAVAE